MTPEEYEHHVADILRSEGWTVHVTSYGRDFGIDVIAERDGRRMGVQVKMYGSARRSVGVPAVMQTYGAAAYADCPAAMIVVDGQVLPQARAVAEKLGIAIRVIPAASMAALGSPRSRGGLAVAQVTFGEIWKEAVIPLEGSTLTRTNGKTNEVLRVDNAGLLRRTSTGRTQLIEIEIFRWVIEKLLLGDVVTRDEINHQCPGRASSGIMLVLSELPMVETTKVGAKQAVRLRSSTAPPSP